LVFLPSVVSPAGKKSGIGSKDNTPHFINGRRYWQDMIWKKTQPDSESIVYNRFPEKVGCAPHLSSDAILG
jgi:hypothetical protein